MCDVFSFDFLDDFMEFGRVRESKWDSHEVCMEHITCQDVFDGLSGILPLHSYGRDLRRIRVMESDSFMSRNTQ